MVIRPRTSLDLDECERLAAAVRDHDGYPIYLPTDLRTFVATPGALEAWVAVTGDVIVGHVALNSSSSDEVIALATKATGHPGAGFGVVSRLLVSPDVRGQGIGTCLLNAAADHALALGLWPILDVTTHSQDAIALYEGQGWERVGEVTVTFGGSEFFHEYVYVHRLSV